MDKQVTCIKRAAGGLSPVGRITQIGGPFGRETEEHAIERLRAQRDTYFVVADGSSRTNIHVVELDGLKPFLATVGGNLPLHDLEILSECPPAALPMPGDFTKKET